MKQNDNKQKSKGSRVLLGFLLVTIIGGIIAGGSIAAISYFESNDQIKIKDSIRLIVGVEKEHDDLPVGLSMTVKDEETVLYASTYFSNSEDMKVEEGQPSDLVFHDYTDEISQFIGQSIFQWINATEGYYGHRIIVQTICLNGSIRSSDFYISDSGIYWIGVALKNGEEPCASSYAAIYHGTGDNL